MFDGDDPQFAVANAALWRLERREEPLFTTAQNIAEFWNVLTRPETARGGYGKLPEVAEHRISTILLVCELLTESPSSFAEWRRLMSDFQVLGTSVHDARIAAIMRVNKISHILTLDGSGFQRYPFIVAEHPRNTRE
ncbi:MAG: type II toxin-antitoxin system VapC family toxin [Planctomycetia bacterium]|nr:type II toxin-antitoxin system VapC family toxin [Planctomycetia bacterium]